MRTAIYAAAVLVAASLTAPVAAQDTPATRLSTLVDAFYDYRLEQFGQIETANGSTRRGPAPEAQALYEDLSPPAPPPEDRPAPAPKFEGGGRPTKKDRRKSDEMRQHGLE